MNIQIDNPISILNQDVSKTFLVSSKSEEKYELFMKATRLDVIGNNYREAIISSEEASKKLVQANEVCIYFFLMLSISNKAKNKIKKLYRYCIIQKKNSMILKKE